MTKREFLDTLKLKLTVEIDTDDRQNLQRVIEFVGTLTEEQVYNIHIRSNICSPLNYCIRHLNGSRSYSID